MPEEITTNERFLQIRGKVATDKDYNYGDDIPVTVCVTSIEHKNNEDGTEDIIYKAKLFGEE